MTSSGEGTNKTTKPELRETLGERVAKGIVAEFAFWVIVGVLWLVAALLGR